MELPRRARGDECLAPGELTALRGRIRDVAAAHDLATVIACAFDHRTRVLPFIGADLRMAPAGVRELGATMVDAGFEKTRVVLQQWNKNFTPSEMRLDGRVPDIFMVSSMSLHSTRAKQLVADACRIDPAQRPLIVVGGPWSIYQPWDAYDPDAPGTPDLVVTGETYVWMSVLERLLAERGRDESIRSTFLRARDRGLLADIPGLCYAHTDSRGAPVELIDTGVQRLLLDLDETAHPRLGYRLLEAPSRKRTLASKPFEAHKVRKRSPVSSLILTFGCKFRCPYCPIPAYNQRQHRLKSPERIADEFKTLYEEYGFKLYFGTDDNFFNDHDRTLAIMEELARVRVDGVELRKRIRWGTEATVHDALKLKDHLGMFRRSGLAAIWMGVEDLTATFVKKGQSVSLTTEAFTLLRNKGIHPMPMMMHHDGQPLYTRGKPYGLINQARILRKHGAVSFQVLMMTPSTGSKLYQEAFEKGLVFKSASGHEVGPHMLDANYVVASEDKKPWRKQLNLMIAYMYFYNPLRLIWAIFFPKSRLYLADMLSQMHGMWGLLFTMRRTIPWAWRLKRGKIEKQMTPPVSKLPIRAATGGRADHALDAQDACAGATPATARPAP